MTMDETIKRINELYHKSQDVGLTEEEKEEQKRVRQIYIDSIKRNLGAQLDNIQVVDTDGSVSKLNKKNK